MCRRHFEDDLGNRNKTKLKKIRENEWKGRGKDRLTPLSAELHNYWAAPTARTAPLGSTTCAVAQGCLVDSLPSSVLPNMQSAQVLLGLTPSLIGLVAPTINELATLMVTRPLLASLLAAGVPTPNLSDLFSSFNPGLVLEDKFAPSAIVRSIYQFFRADREGRTSWAWKGALVISCLEYLLAGGILVNMLVSAVDLGRKSNVVWRCNTNFLPLTWTLYGLLVFWIAAAGACACLFAPLKIVSRNSEPPISSLEFSTIGVDRSAPVYDEADTRGGIDPWKLHLVSEFVPHLFRTHGPAWIAPQDPERTTILSEICCVTATTLALGLLAYGTALTSSLLYISVDDAAVVVARFLAAALLCRMVVMFELGGMRYVVKSRSNAIRTSSLQLSIRSSFPSSLSTLPIQS